MAQWVLKANSQVVPRRSLRPLKPKELRSENETRKRKLFDELIERRWGTSINPPKVESTENDDNFFEEYNDSDDFARVIPDIEDSVDSTGKLINQQPAYDAMLNAEVRMNVGNYVANGKVKRRAIGADGKLIGTYDDNPILNTMIYEVEFPDGQIKEYSASLFAKTMLSQVDNEVFSITMMEGIVDHKKDEAIAVSKDDAYVITSTSHKTPDVAGSTYAGVGSRKSVSIALTYAALNHLQVCVTDIQNTYLQAPSSQKDYVICGPEFGLENIGNLALIHHALYGGKAAGRDFHSHLRECMQQL
jgi:hypothetical protein